MKGVLLLVLACTVEALMADPTPAKLKTLYNSLDPTSISQHLALFELYPDSEQGQKALNDAWTLLAGKQPEPDAIKQRLPSSAEIIQSLVFIANKPIDREMPLLDGEFIATFNELSKNLPHRKLKGHSVWSEQELLTLPLEQIDLARGLFLSQFGNVPQKIQSYEAFIDLMALQILARLPHPATPEEKIIAINGYIFDEMGFRFPPHALSTKEIDIYTFLPSVLDSRRGVCLGVSILYLCLAQRLDLPLEMITPPGHIFVRYCTANQTINIETTARGIHLDSEEYLGINTRSLQQRTIKEVIGMAHFNQASVFWQNGEYAKALQAYQKAEPYMRGDPLLKELMGYVLILTGEREAGEQNLKEIKDFTPEYALFKNTTAQDYLLGHIDAKGISALFTHVEEDRPSILAKKETLEKILAEFPQFRAGHLSLAITWLQLNRQGEALEALKRYRELEPRDPEAHYYLAALYAERNHYLSAWQHLKDAEAIVKAKNHNPKVLKELRRDILKRCPDPNPNSQGVER